MGEEAESENLGVQGNGGGHVKEGNWLPFIFSSSCSLSLMPIPMVLTIIMLMISQSLT